MTALQLIKRLQLMALLIGLAFAVDYLVSPSSLLKVSSSQLLGLSMTFLTLHSVLHFLSFEARERLLRASAYYNPGVCVALSAQVLLVDVAVWDFARVNTLSFGQHAIILFVATSLLIAANVLLPPTWQLRRLDAHMKRSQNRAQVVLRKELQRKTSDLLGSGEISEIQYAKIGQESSYTATAGLLAKAIAKVEGLEEIIKYIVLDKYLEMLEMKDSSSAMRTIRRFCGVALLGAVLWEVVLMTARHVLAIER